MLLVNMFVFGAYSDEWTGALDRVCQVLKQSLFDTKSLRLFSMLFGFGFCLQLLKAEERGSPFLGFFIRRLAVLFVIGVGHSFFFDGDILMKYAALGLLLLVFRRVPPRLLLALAIVLMAVYPIGNAVVIAKGEPPPFDEADLTLDERREGHPYLGSLTEVLAANTHAIPPRLFSKLHSPESSLALLAMFLLGLYVGRRGILRDIPGHRGLIRRWMIWGLSFGLGSSFVIQILIHGYDYQVFGAYGLPLGIQILGDTLFAYGSTALSIGYAGTIISLLETGRCAWLLRQFGNLGRMALTVYLSGTFLFTLLFYGYGFGQLFMLGPAATTGFAVLFFAMQIAFCAWWSRRYRFGPMEWLWRSATYGRLQPNRLAAHT
ncbi:MAG: DUF418 domain-containing protein [Planctomycetota bacterium]|nr:DUF418 domain-containing protein [Planctomycetota bacterium]